MFVFESLDKDTELRRLSPIAVGTRDGYIDLINGPQDHGWCHGYTCQERVSMFQMLMNMGRHYDLYTTSYNPQKTRLMILNADEEDVVRVAIYYAKPQRLDIYRQGKLRCFGTIYIFKIFLRICSPYFLLKFKIPLGNKKAYCRHQYLTSL